MALGPRLDLRQSQSLVMTPQLQQAIRLLALSNVEIETYIAGELEKNPLLEMARDEASGDGSADDGTSSEPEGQGDATAGTNEAASDAMMHDGALVSESPLDVGNASDANGDSDDAGPSAKHSEGLSGAGGVSGEYSNAGGSGQDGPDFDSFAASETGLHEHLMDQARMRLSGMELLIASQLIGQIDEAGYLESDLLQLAYALKVAHADVEAVLAIVQSFDPIGVGARSLSECLMLQAQEVDRCDPAMATLIANLDLLAKGAFVQLRRICGVDEEDLADMIRELRSYDPKPGLRFASDDNQTVIPDIFITPKEADDNGSENQGWSIEINSATLPRVLINRVYYTELSGGVQDKESKAWLSDCLANANWLIKALDQRQKTIIKVATEIVKQQEDFFRKGVAHLKPMTLKSVAEAIDMHESTVSRVTSNKYLSCPRGLYELKYFFTSGIASSDGGEAVSAQSVKSRIKALIMAEEPRKILSDDTLVDMLRAEGFDIARRTVAKYRESMGIGSSVQRRRQKALAG